MNPIVFARRRWRLTAGEGDLAPECTTAASALPVATDGRNATGARQHVTLNEGGQAVVAGKVGRGRGKPASRGRRPNDLRRAISLLGRKRHILTDTLGLLLAVNLDPASVQDRDGAEALLREARRSFPSSASLATSDAREVAAVVTLAMIHLMLRRLKPTS